MKLVIAVVQGEDAQRASEALTSAGFGSTRMTSSGGFLQQGNVTFLIGVEDTRPARDRSSNGSAPKVRSGTISCHHPSQLPTGLNLFPSGI